MLKQDVDIKNIDIADLLRREPKDLDRTQIKKFIQGKSVLITGAGGSIGSEISRQCLKFGAKRLILVDHSEFNLYTLQEELGSSERVRYVLLNVLYTDPLEACFKEEKPEIVFHAAAYKHVPLVEQNPFEGVLNNVKGTGIVADLSVANGVHKFVLISTDKAVRPTSVMGASKRVAELFIQNLNVRSQTEFISVRFGNVLGSSGSVIPKFLEQIKKGGPVTVTHPEVTRYFMLIPEAVQLVMQAASIGNGGEIFILNMGKPIRIADMAEDLIYLSGREPHKDVAIEYTGLRPGEKLYEELLHDEAEKKTHYENITIGRATYMDWDKLNSQITIILDRSKQKDRGGLLQGIKVLVPEFMHADLGPAVSVKSKVISLR
jgi:FlaA1/EpsC-like NDP-sugar epimerase